MNTFKEKSPLVAPSGGYLARQETRTRVRIPIPIPILTRMKKAEGLRGMKMTTVKAEMMTIVRAVKTEMLKGVKIRTGVHPFALRKNDVEVRLLTKHATLITDRKALVSPDANNGRAFDNLFDSDIEALDGDPFVTVSTPGPSRRTFKGKENRAIELLSSSPLIDQDNPWYNAASYQPKMPFLNM